MAVSADIRRGTCDSVDSIGRRAISALAPLDDHRSETFVELSVNELRSRDYVVVVLDGGRSLPAQGIIACSELGSARRPWKRGGHVADT